MNRQILFFFLILILLIGCKENSYKKNIKIYVDKTFIIPDTLTIKANNKLLNVKEINNLFSKPIKIAIFIDGDCEFCFNQLQDWKSLIYSNEINSNYVSFLIYVHSYDYRAFDSYLADIKFEYPIIYDSKNIYFQNNQLTKGNVFNTVVLDRANTVVLVGNPITRPEFRNIFIKKIVEMKNDLLDIRSL